MLNWLGKSGGQHQIGARQAAALVPGWRRDGVEIHPDSALSRSALLFTTYHRRLGNAERCACTTRSKYFVQTRPEFRSS